MKRTLIAVLALLVAHTSIAAPDFDKMGVDEDNSLVIPGLLTAVAPSPDWEWLVGEVINHPAGLIIRPLYCAEESTDNVFQILVTTYPNSALSDRAAVLEGVLDGARKRLKTDGYDITGTSVMVTNVPSSGFTRYEYAVRSDDAHKSATIVGYTRIQKHSISIQHNASSQDSLTEFESFVRAVSVLSPPDPPSPDHASMPLEEEDKSLSYRIGNVTGVLLVIIAVIGIARALASRRK